MFGIPLALLTTVGRGTSLMASDRTRARDFAAVFAVVLGSLARGIRGGCAVWALCEFVLLNVRDEQLS
jgi:hypothetical protein